MKELVIRQIKEAYTAIHAPESLIQSVISQIGDVRPRNRIGKNTVSAFPEKHKGKDQADKDAGKQ